MSRRAKGRRGDTAKVDAVDAVDRVDGVDGVVLGLSALRNGSRIHSVHYVHLAATPFRPIALSPNMSLVRLSDRT